MIDQEKKVYECLRRHKVLSVREIFNLCNCNSPTKVISELRREGRQIGSKWVTRDGKRWKVYFIREEKTA